MQIKLSELLTSKVSSYLIAKDVKFYLEKNLIFPLKLYSYIDYEELGEFVKKATEFYKKELGLKEEIANGLGRVSGMIKEFDEEYEYSDFYNTSFFLNIASNIKIVSESKYLKNPFIIKYFDNFDATKLYGDLRADISINFSNEDILLYDDFFIQEDGVCIPKLYVPKNNFDSINIFQNDDLFERFDLFDIITIDRHIKKAHGKVVSFGLNFGYFAYMAAAKEEVDKIVIVEDDHNKIAIFKDIFLKNYEHGDKIEIVESDAQEFIINMKEDDFNFAFIANYYIYDRPIYYLEMKKALIKFKNLEKSFWLDKYFANNVSDLFFALFLAEFRSKSELKEVENAIDQLIPELNIIKDIADTFVISDKIDLNKFFSYKNILKLLEKF